MGFAHIKKIGIFFFLFSSLPIFFGIIGPFHEHRILNQAHAEKEDIYTTNDEFLPYRALPDGYEEDYDKSFLKDENLIRNGKIKGIKILKEEKRLVFTIAAEDSRDIEGKGLKFEILQTGFPPRAILRIYGVRSEERIFRFFKNLDILGIVLNPFINDYVLEYVIFFNDWARVDGIYDIGEKRLIIEYLFTEPEYKKGYGVRIVDSKLDPLPQIFVIHRELARYGLKSYLLLASDHETVVLESPFYVTRSEAIAYMESLENFGYKGKLAIRNYADFPEPNRFDVVSEMVITGEEVENLQRIVYNELLPEKIYNLNYSEIRLITKNIFSPRIQNDEDAISEYYYKLSEIYRNYENGNAQIKKFADMVSLKILEIIYFFYRNSKSADDALWGIATLIREQGVKDVLSEEDCYRKIIAEYPDSPFSEEALARLGIKKKRSYTKLTVI